MPARSAPSGEAHQPPGVEEEATVITGPTGVGMPVDAMVEAGTLNLVPISVHRRPSHEP